MTRDVRSLIAAVFFANWLQVGVLILAPLKAVDLGYPAAMAAALAALWGLLGVAFDLPVSAISDGRGRRSMVMAGGLAMAAAAAMFAIAGDFGGLVVGIVLFSTGQALAIGPLLAWLTEVTAAADQRRVQGLNGFAQGVSSVGAAMAAGGLAQLGFDVAFVPLVGAALVIVAAAAKPSELDVGRRLVTRAAVLGAHVRAVRMAVSRPAVGFAALGVVLFAIAFPVVASTVLPIVLVDFEGYAPATVGLLLALRNVVAAVAALTFARTSRRWGVTRMQVRLGVAAVAGTALVGVTLAEPFLLAGALILQGVGVAFAPAAANVLASEATEPGERAVAIASLVVSARGTVLIVPLILTPFLVPSAGGLVFLVAAVLGMVVLALMLRVSRRIPAGIGSASPADRRPAPVAAEPERA